MLMQPIKGLLSIAFTCIPKRQKIVEECHGKYMFFGVSAPGERKHAKTQSAKPCSTARPLHI